MSKNCMLIRDRQHIPMMMYSINIRKNPCICMCAGVCTQGKTDPQRVVDEDERSDLQTQVRLPINATVTK